MARIFIAYARKNGLFATRLAGSLSNVGVEVWIDVVDIPAGAKWYNSIQEGLDLCDILLLIISPEAMQSSNVEDEWRYFRNKQKPIIPVLYKPTDVHYQLASLQYIDFHSQDYTLAFAQLHSELRRKGLRLNPITFEDDSVVIPQQKPLPISGRRKINWQQVLVLLIVPLSIAVIAAVIQITPWLSQQAREADATRAALLLTSNSTFIEATLNTVERASTADVQGTPTPTSDHTFTPISNLYEEAIAQASIFAGTNEDWRSIYPNGFINEFGDGVPMVLVPAGCFTMGSTDDQIAYAMTLYIGRNRTLYNDETPTENICFAEPFWIDLYEVTQGDFARLEGQAGGDTTFADDNRPREYISAFEAGDFCTLRGARLPTEAEWEYAARGPDSLIYPWGNTFVEDNVVYAENSNNQTAEVGSRLGGMSWVGALDMSGNVWEWTSTLYAAYPYLTDVNGIIVDDQREDESSMDSRVLRGGAWDYADVFVRAPDRNDNDPLGRGENVGFRCARDAQ